LILCATLKTVITGNQRRLFAVVLVRRIYCLHIMSGPKMNIEIIIKGLKEMLMY
jgi:hypothetical protein